MSNAPAATAADKITDQLDAAGKSLLWLSRATLIPYSTLERKVKGGGDFTVTDLQLIAKALGIAPRAILPDSLVTP